MVKKNIEKGDLENINNNNIAKNIPWRW